MLEDARSALPPIRPGTTLASAFKHCWERFLVASAGLSGVYFWEETNQGLSSESHHPEISFISQANVYTYWKSINPVSRQLPGDDTFQSCCVLWVLLLVHSKLSIPINLKGGTFWSMAAPVAAIFHVR
jgi:hypothetical protein